MARSTIGFVCFEIIVLCRAGFIIILSVFKVCLSHHSQDCEGGIFKSSPLCAEPCAPLPSKSGQLAAQPPPLPTCVSKFILRRRKVPAWCQVDRYQEGLSLFPGARRGCGHLHGAQPVLLFGQGWGVLSGTRAGPCSRGSAILAGEHPPAW